MTGGLLLDLALVVGLCAYAVSGWRQGIVVSALSLAGFLAGGALGMWVLPTLVAGSDWGQNHHLAASITVVAGVFFLASIGQGVLWRVGRRARTHLHGRALRRGDSFLGAVATIAAASVLVWFVAGGLRGATTGAVGQAIGSSQVIRAIDAVVPPQTGRLFAGFRQVLDRGGFPRVFDGLSREAIAPIDPPTGTPTALPAVATAVTSVVKITGVAAACRQGQEGSGWVVSPRRVVTNAHVVAGVSDVDVQVPGTREVARGKVVVFDPDRDLAVIDVPTLRATPLRLGADVTRGQEGVVAGYPLDGPLRLDAARVREVLYATGQDIYGQPGVTRQIISLYTHVDSGNSGGPLLSTDGEVVGIVFAKSLDDESTGYALTLAEARPVLEAAASARGAVSTGACTVG